MNLVECAACGNDISKQAIACPNCGHPSASKGSKGTAGKDVKSIGGMLCLGIFLFPLIFSWVTLKKEYSNTIRTVSFLWMLIVFLYMWSIPTDEGQMSPAAAEVSSKPQKIPEQVAAEQTECRKDLKCWAEENFISATVHCNRYIEQLAEYSHRWTNAWLEPKFSYYRWKDISAGVVTYIGDKIQFQNGFGAFQNHVYECDYSPTFESVIDVRAEPGKI
ncbi:hypothetical protein ACJJIC_12495 [Microbulbifer sp. ANSA002]|uniref:hypothetical protein n=1 Tax=unclassified Microbulbifer TaxID=2619833 RepID=UPI004043615B